MSIYQKHELVRQNVFQRLFKIQPKENFIIEFENNVDLFAIMLSRLMNK